jgi:hypothetical protein
VALPFTFRNIFKANEEELWKLKYFTKQKCYLQQGITNTLALPKIRCLYIYLLCPQSEQNTQKIHSNLNILNTFTKETGSSNVKPVLIRKNFQKLDPMR